MRRSIKIGILCLAALLPAVGVLKHAGSHAPIRDGTPRDFWLTATGIDILGEQAEPSWIGGLYPPQNDWAVYFIVGFHDQFLYRVKLAEVAPYMPEVIERLETQANRDDLHPAVQQMVTSGIKRGKEPSYVRAFEAAIHMHQLELAQHANDADSHAYLIESERLFAERWKRAQWYPLTLAFECFWLGGLLVFAGLPWIRRASCTCWAIHWGLLPSLLFLPYFCGYATYTFTSAFPSGGVYYPYVLIWFRGLPWTRWDTWILQAAPQLFEPFAQQPGPMLAVTGMGNVGPTATCLLGLAVTLAIMGAGTVIRGVRARRAACR